MPAVPHAIAAADPGVVRPRDLRHTYAHPAKELRRLTDAGALLRLAHGYFAVVPERYRGGAWRPSIEAVGLALAQRDYGRDAAAAMGASAARLLGAMPRALGSAVVAVPRQRPALDTAVGLIRFVTRTVARLDVQRVDTELTSGWVTTAEQTILDLADRPELGDLPLSDIVIAIRRLAARVDWQQIGALAKDQRKRPAAVRAAQVVGVASPVEVSRTPSMAGLSPLLDEGHHERRMA
ncbi:MAG: type IV toxin-antitoxin system AbiEi family antitoxin [Egibacteraceae bacterium]